MHISLASWLRNVVAQQKARVGTLKYEVEDRGPFCQGIRVVLAQETSKEKPHPIGTVKWARKKEVPVIKRLPIVNVMYYSNTA